MNAYSIYIKKKGRDLMDQVKVSLKGGVEKLYPKGVTLLEIAKDISRKLSKEAVAAKVDGVIKDLGSKIDDDCQVEILDI
jgi:threonyl-tRNA synthetase